MPFSRRTTSERRKLYLKLTGLVEGQLREALALQNATANVTQAVVAKKIGVNKSIVSRRLSGQSNLTIESISDLVWALDHDISLKIFPFSEKKVIKKSNKDPLGLLDEDLRNETESNILTFEAA